MLRFDQVSKRYLNGQEALKHVSFSLKKGQMAFLTGHSGAGKSTLLKLIVRLEEPTSGQILANNRNLSRLKSWQIPYMRRQIGLVLQNPQLIPERNVFANVALPLIVSGIRYKDQQRLVAAALDKVSLLTKAKAYPLQLSVGEQQRVGIARAIVNRPTLLLADEPTGNLDPDLSRDIMMLFANFEQIGTTILVATHDLSLIKKMSYPILYLTNGMLVSPHV